MKFSHSFTVRSTLSAVRDFHANSNSMAIITPPPVLVRIHKAPQTLREGDEIIFTLWMLFLPINWVAHIENLTRDGFYDRQLKGPFKSWVHRHTFVEHSAGMVEVKDEVQAELSNNPLWWLIGAGMWLSLPVLFAYRGWKTRRMLE